MTTTTKLNAKADPVVLPVDLRDYFAAAMDVEYQFKDMTGDCAEALGVPMPLGQGSAAWPRWRAAMRAKLRYMAADAMLKARSASQ